MVMTLAPLQAKPGRTYAEQLHVLMQQGFSRILLNDQVVRIEELLESKMVDDLGMDSFIIIDRFAVSREEPDLCSRVADSLQIAFFEGDGDCVLDYELNGKKERRFFSSRFELDGMTFEEPGVNLFTFNNPFGACKTCEGFGSVIGIDPDLVIPIRVCQFMRKPLHVGKEKKWGNGKIILLTRPTCLISPFTNLTTN
jgi:excinuclease ABC subunit A